MDRRSSEGRSFGPSYVLHMTSTVSGPLYSTCTSTTRICATTTDTTASTRPRYSRPGPGQRRRTTCVGARGWFWTYPLWVPVTRVPIRPDRPVATRTRRGSYIVSVLFTVDLRVLPGSGNPSGPRKCVHYEVSSTSHFVSTGHRKGNGDRAAGGPVVRPPPGPGCV